MAYSVGRMALCVLFVGAATAAPSSMQAVHKKGFLPCSAPFDCVQLYTTAVPTPGPRQLLVKVSGSSVNPCDVDYLEFGVGCGGGGGTLGMDVAGVVVAVGPEASGRFTVGDSVWADIAGGTGTTGGMAEYAILDEANTGLVRNRLSTTF